MAWSWIDRYAALGGLALTLAALCGLVLVRPPQTGARPPLRARRAPALVGAAAALALASMAAAMAGHGGPVPWLALDGWADTWMRQHLTSAWRGPLVAFTQLGHVGVLLALGAAVLLALLWRRDWLHAGMWLVGTAGTGLWTRALKHAVARPRPEHGWVAESGHSFPSGHSAGTLALYALLAWLVLPQLRRAWRLPVALAAICVALAVGASRVLLRVHFASDVLAGWLLALAWLACVIVAVQWAQRRRGP
ncbi:phosphatase PAP2 family protein [Pulveribacter suum]|uniref:Phosphoesterase PA-phosphatase n=1 Tax=Pulveribacter suum TaxID=2116657 RepID=A0A2P1NGW1_9BURK|nr:phosphatase PAP2 family protein [Pulveribacter suum]AVP56305.1 phosphoesterase PA-phosphatase [Pulveribacter suum]